MALWRIPPDRATTLPAMLGFPSRRPLLVLPSVLLLVSSLAGPAAPVLADDSGVYVVDNSDRGVAVAGVWSGTGTTSGFYGANYLFRVAGDGSSSVRWPFPSGAAAGRYEVQARWTSGANRASNAVYVINAANGSTPVTVNQQTGGGAWQSLGTFDFAADPATNGVTLTDKADGVVVADAVRWVKPGGGGPAQSAPVAAATPASSSGDARFFDATSYRIDNDAFWDFFSKRGGVRTFGYPVSRAFLFMGCTSQFFQRLIMQQCGNSGVGTLNLLDGGLMPYTQINGSTYPAADQALIDGAPSPNDPNYASLAVDYVKKNAPESVDGEPTRFFTTFQSTVTLRDAFPTGGGDPNLLPLVNLQVWGLPTSKPAQDPNNHDFIYQRFQRGIMHYDKGCRCTQGLLLADYFKALLTGDLLPADLAAQAAGSPLLRAAKGGQAPIATTFGDAFVQASPQLTAAAPTPTPGPAAAAPPPTAALAPPPPIPGPLVTSPDYGLNLFVWGHPTTTDRDLSLTSGAGFRWQKSLFQWRQIEGGGKGQFDWSEADRVVRAASMARIKTIARLDFQPTWARKDGANNGPPDNYQDYWDFVQAFMSRYSSSSNIGRVYAVEVWNEPNIDREWGNQPISPQSAADYVRLLGGAYTAAKAADPNVIVLSAGLSPTGVTNDHSADDVQYLQWLYDAGIQGTFDALGAHGNTQAPCVECDLNSLPAFGHPSFYFRRVEQLRDVMVRNGDQSKQVWLLEFGWTSDNVHPAYSWFAVSEDQKAANIVKAFQYARQNWTPWIGVMTLWTISDPSWTPEREEYWWAITNPDGTVRPAYRALTTASQAGAFQ
jgi:polysaccharide biosynthesis protein PslG